MSIKKQGKSPPALFTSLSLVCKSCKSMIPDIEDINNDIENLPDDQVYTQDELDTLEDLLHVARKLCLTVEAVFEDLIRGPLYKNKD